MFMQNYENHNIHETRKYLCKQLQFIGDCWLEIKIRLVWVDNLCSEKFSIIDHFELLTALVAIYLLNHGKTASRADHVA